MSRFCLPAVLRTLLGCVMVGFFAYAPVGQAQGLWSEYAMVSATLGVNDGRLCLGESSRGDIGCPTYAPQVMSSGLLSATDISATGNISANMFIGDGSALTGVTAAATDRIVSGTTTLLVTSATGFVSLTQGGTNTGWFDPQRGLVTLGVSTTGGISTTTLFGSQNVLIGTGGLVSSSRLRIYSTGATHDKLLEITGSGITGGQTGPFYGAYIDAISNNNATARYGVYARAGGSGDGPNYGVYGQTSMGSSSRRAAGLYGQVDVNSGAVNNHPALSSAVAGVMAVVSTTGTYYSAATTALLARNESVYGATSFGAYIDAVAGPTTVIPLRVDYNTSEVMRVDSSGTVVSKGISVTTNNTSVTTLYASQKVGFATTNPSTALHVSGTVRIANGGEACDANRTGAIRYTGGDFEFCRDGVTWQTLASVADSAAPDRIVSGTTTLVVTSATGYISLTQGGTNTGWFDPQRGLVTLGVSTTGGISTTTLFGSQNVLIGTGGLVSSSRLRIYSTGTTHDKLLEIKGNAVAGGQTGPFYGAYIDAISNNNATARYGVYASAGGGGSGPTYGVYGQTYMGSSSRRAVGLYGQVDVNSGATNNHPALSSAVAGVMAVVSTTGTSYNAATTALLARNESVYGATSFGAYIDAVAGPTTVIPLRVDYNTSEVMRVDSSGTVVSKGISVTTNNTSVTTLYASQKVGFATTNPSTALHVSGTVRIANGGEACDANRTGAIRYTGGDFEFCRDGVTWQTLANVADSAAPDRIVSGTTTLVVTSATGYISLTQGGTNTGWFDPARGLVTLGVSSTGPISGTNGYFNGNLTVRGVIDIVTGTEVVAVGQNANYLSSGSYVTAVGIAAARQNTGAYVTALGYNAAHQSSGTSVTGVGAYAAYQNSGANVTGIGVNAAYLNTGANVTGLGSGGAMSNTGTYVTGVGYYAAYLNTGANVTSIGVNAARQNTGANVTGMGFYAAYLNTGANVTGMGFYAAQSNTGNNVTAIGASAARTNTAANVVAIGYEAGYNNAVANQFILKQNSVNSMPLMQGDFATGNLGIGTTSPTARLHVSGTLRLANGGEACDADRTGAIRYTGGDFEFCRDGVTWQTLANVADSAAPDRIVSGTTTLVVTSATGYISLTQGGTNTGWFDPQRGLVTLGVSSTGMISGTGGYFSGNVGIGVASPLGNLHIVKSATGATPNSSADALVIEHNNHGGLSILSANNASGRIYFGDAQDDDVGRIIYNHASNTLSFATNGTSDRMVIVSTGYVGVGTTAPGAPLEVSGTVSATLLKLAADPTDVCDTANLGAVKIAGGKIMVCRQ